MTEVPEVNVAAPEEVDSKDATVAAPEDGDTKNGMSQNSALDPQAVISDWHAICGFACKVFFLEEVDSTEATVAAPEEVDTKNGMSQNSAFDPQAGAPCRCFSRLCAAFQDADKATELGVNVSLFFVALIEQGQIVANFRHPEDMVGLRWNGYCAGSMHDLILASFFCSIGEPAQTRVNIFGCLITFFPLLQMFAYRLPGSPEPGLVPPIPFFILTAVIISGLLIISLRSCGKGKDAFDRWMHFLTMLGGALVAFSLTYEIQDDLGVNASRPVLAKAINGGAGSAGFVLLLCMVLMKRTSNSTGPWLATLLFMYMPLPQIRENFVHPASAADFAIEWIYCFVMANGLGMARAVYTRNVLWVTGAAWSCFAGVLMSASVVVASARLPEPILTPLELCCLISFNVAVLAYAAMLYVLLGRKKQPGKALKEEDSTTYAGADVLV
jgi:hypothetical protein